MEATKTLGQSVTFVIMDLAAAKIALDLKWHNNVKFSSVLIHLGAFHTMCSYMGALGRMMTGSSFEDILIESGICASGSIAKVLSGKHYNRAKRVHQRMNDALERMMLMENCMICESPTLPDRYDKSSLEKFVTLAANPSHSKMHSFNNNVECMSFVDNYCKYKDHICN